MNLYGQNEDSYDSDERQNHSAHLHFHPPSHSFPHETEHHSHPPEIYGGSEESVYPPQPHNSIGYGNETESELPRGRLVKLVCKAGTDFQLAYRQDGVVLALADSADEEQQWIRDDSNGVRIKDNYGFPAFILINKAHKKVLKHARETGQQVLVADYQPGSLEEDILWTESQEFEEGHRTIRMASNTLLNLTIFRGTPKDGAPVILDTWHKQNSQLWKIIPL